jgi:serine/threonine-protein kinase RsbW
MRTFIMEAPNHNALGQSGPPLAQDSYRQVTFHRATEMALFLHNLVVTLDSLGYATDDALGVRLAVEEAIVNGLRHGNQGDPSKCVRVRYRFAAEELVVDVEDEGPGFDPEQVPDPTQSENLERPSGRGLLLMRYFMTSVRYSGRGNRVTLCKRRTP